MKCPLCSNSTIELIDIKHALFRHVDFATIKQSGCIGRCVSCQLVLNVVTEEESREIENLFRSYEYSQCKTMSHTLFVEDYQKPVTRTFLQAKLLHELLTKWSPSILDIGCFTGELLIELDRCFESAELHGFDVNEHLGPLFPRKGNFQFWSEDLKKVPGHFDLISISGSMMYVRDISNLMEHINRLLKPDGLVFVHAADISKNPYAILLGDQCYHYTPEILGNIFRYYRLDFSVLDCSWCPREMVGIAKPVSSNPEHRYVEDLHIYHCVEYIDICARKLRELRVPSMQIGILGTSGSAAFVDSVLQSKVGYFVDENVERVGGKFRGKDVLHPQSLEDSELVIIPQGASSQRIKERFSKEYKGQFICS